MAIDPRDLDLTDIDPGGDLLEGIPVLSPLAQPLACTWPVHRIGPGYLPDTEPAEPTWIVVYRKRDDEVGFLVLNAVSARLVELIQRDDGNTGRKILIQIATELRHLEPAVVLSAGLDVLKELQAKDILPGVKKK